MSEGQRTTTNGVFIDLEQKFQESNGSLFPRALSYLNAALFQ